MMMLWEALVVVVCISHTFLGKTKAQNTACYTDDGQAIRCTPNFINAAYGLSVEATNTCGQRVEYDSDGRLYSSAKKEAFKTFFRQTGASGARSEEDSCDQEARNPLKRHPPKNMVDLDEGHSTTWWQSITLYEYKERELGDMIKATITLHLGKAFDITYIRLKFHSPRPESFAIFKRTSESTEWIPYQYYSASCFQTYKLTQNGMIDHATRAICTGEYSDISPLSGGDVAFSTLQGRPGAYEFESRPLLQEFVTATDIKIELTRLNTFGDEVFEDTSVLQSYYYAISDISVGGRCKCNGHASECVKSSGLDQTERLVCLCQHNTMGPDCGECGHHYNNKPWAPATSGNANVCEKCDCNGRSERCYFDEELYYQTGGSGGHCTECRDFTDGVNCERCQENYYRSDVRDICSPCHCDETGSRSQQCDSNGQCACKPGVAGEKCDRCEANYYDFGTYGCRECGCVESGSFENTPYCDSTTGQCTCKENVEGQNCDTCKPGFFNLDLANRFGCIACFCNGKVSNCTSAPGYKAAVIESGFDTGTENWLAVDDENSDHVLNYNGIMENIGVSTDGLDGMIYFNAPLRYLGDQKFSYNQNLTFDLRIGESQGRPGQTDIILEGNGRVISLPIFAQNNPTPGLKTQSYTFRLHEHPKYQWTPSLTAIEFQRLLSSLTAIKIRATYNALGTGFLDTVELSTAHNGQQIGDLYSIEQCNCPDQYVGQFCESCAPGYRRAVQYGGASSDCVPCECNGHSDTCDVESGACICMHNTTGHNCEKCLVGFYGNALDGTAEDCTACPCPEQGPCFEQEDSTVTCLDCPSGFGGDLCMECSDGFYGNPEEFFAGDDVSECITCDCNGNIDSNAVGNCNRTNGVCRKCVYNTGGDHCETCLSGFYGDAMSDVKGDCKACECNVFGTVAEDLDVCALEDGQCNCLPNVQGRQCDQCVDGFYNLQSKYGCEPCFCHAQGANTSMCELETGQCECKMGLGGLQCADCLTDWYGSATDGCDKCMCSETGSAHGQCDQTGQCECLDSSRITGLHCDTCRENKFNFTAGCLDCPACYNLVQDAVNEIRDGRDNLTQLLKNINENPNVDDADFVKLLGSVKKDIDVLYKDAKELQDRGGPVSDDLQAIISELDKLGEITRLILQRVDNSEIIYSTLDMETLKSDIEILTDEVSDADTTFRNESTTLYLRILEALNEHGQKSDNMTDLAQQSSDLAMEHEINSDAIVEQADDAHSISEMAAQLARDVVSAPDSMEEQLRLLQQRLDLTDELLMKTKDLAESAKIDAEKVYNSSLDSYKQASDIQVEESDTVIYLKEANATVEDAKEQKMKAMELEKQYESVLNDSTTWLEKARIAYDKAYNEQQVTDELMLEVDVALENALEAIADADRLLADAQETLRTLQEFDQRVKEHKEVAVEAMKEVPTIEELLDEADNETALATAAVDGARSAATEAEELALEAQATAEDASMTAAEILNEAQTTKQLAIEKSNQTDSLGEDLADSEETITELEKTGETEKALIQTVLTDAEEAKKIAVQSAEELRVAGTKVAEIISKLNNLPPLNTTELERLEAEFAALEEQYKNGKLDSLTKELEAFETQQSMRTADSVSQLKQLQADVTNIQMIVETIPNDCYKKPALEISPTAGRKRLRKLKKLRRKLKKL